MSLFQRYLRDVLPLPSWLRAEIGERYILGLIGVSADVTAELLAFAMKSAWPKESSLSAGAAQLLSAERGIYQLATETVAAFGTRLTNVWATWAAAGTDGGIIQALADHGWPNAEIYTDADWSKPPTPWWSQFWLFFPHGTHGVGPAYTWGGSAVWGDGKTWGSSMTVQQMSLFRKVVNQFRPAARICRAVIFETSSTGPGSPYSPWNGNGVELVVTVGAPTS